MFQNFEEISLDIAKIQPVLKKKKNTLKFNARMPVLQVPKIINIDIIDQA